MADWLPFASEVAGNISSGLASYLVAKENRGWQEKMSNTAVQRRRKDLVAAGINPYLAGNEGAVTPSGNAPVIASPTSGLTANYLQKKKIKQQDDLISAQIRDVKAHADVNSAMADKIKVDKLNVTQDTANKVQNLKNLQKQLDSLELQMEGTKSDNKRKILDLQHTKVKSRWWRLVNELLDMFDKGKARGENYFMQDLEEKFRWLRKKDQIRLDR